MRFVTRGRKVGEFQKDLGGGSVDKIAFIDVSEIENYFDWGEIGRKIIERAVELKKTF